MKTGVCRRNSYHDRLSFVLDNVARAANLVSAAQAGEENLIGGINGVIVEGG